MLAQQNIEVMNGYGFNKGAGDAEVSDTKSGAESYGHTTVGVGVPARSRLRREDGGGDVPALLQHDQE